MGRREDGILEGKIRKERKRVTFLPEDKKF